MGMAMWRTPSQPDMILKVMAELGFGRKTPSSWEIGRTT
jgi:hypothetical protein